MPRIKVDPVQLRALSTQLQQAAGDLQGIGGRIGSAMGSLDWEARQKAGVDARVSDARGRANALASQSEAMARYLVSKAHAFEEADQQGLRGCQDLSIALAQILREARLPSHVDLGLVMDEIRRLTELGELLLPTGAAALIGLSMYAGTTYAGQVIINLPDWIGRIVGLREIREAAGLSGYLTHFRYTTLPSHMLRIGLLTSIPVIAARWGADVWGYATGAATGTQTVSAMVVDAAFTLAPVIASFAVSQAVTAGLTLLGTLLCPGLGTAAGFAVGVAATSLISGVAAGVATQWALGREGVREQAITWVDENVARPVAQAVSACLQGFADRLNVAANMVANMVFGGARP